MITAEFVFLATILPSLASGAERTEARVSPKGQTWNGARSVRGSVVNSFDFCDTLRRSGTESSERVGWAL